MPQLNLFCSFLTWHDVGLKQDYTDALKQKVVKLQAMAARNSSDKLISAQVCSCPMHGQQQ